MKRNLGRFIITFLTLSIVLFAKEDYFFESKVSKRDIYLNEAVILQVEFHKREYLSNISIEFEPKSDKNFQIERIERRLLFKDGYQIERFKYLLFPNRVGKVELNLKPKLLIASKDAIKETTVGKDLPVELYQKSKVINLDSIEFQVEKLNVKYVGEFKLESKIDKLKALENEPIHLRVKLKKPFTKTPIDINYSIEGVKIFQRDLSFQKFDTYELIEREFVFVSDRNFTIAPLEIKYLNPKTKEIEIAKSENYQIEIYRDEKIFSSLLEHKEDNVESIKSNIRYILTLYPYLVVFIIGVLFGKLLNFKILKREFKELSFKERVKRAKTNRELIQLLLPKNSEFRYELNMLELKDEKLSKVKKSILKKLQG